MHLSCQPRNAGTACTQRTTLCMSDYLGLPHRALALRTQAHTCCNGKGFFDGPAQFDSLPGYTVVSISQLDLASAALQQRWTTLLSPQRLPQFLGTVVTHAAGRLKVRPQRFSCLASAFPAVVHLVTDTNLISTQTPITLINRLSEHTDGTILSRPHPPKSSPP